MSTKIYNGIKFNTTDINEIINFLKSIREKSKEINTKSLYKQIDKFFPLYFSRSKRNNKLSNYDITKEIMKSFKNMYRTFVDLDFRFEVIIFPRNSRNEWYGYYIDETGKCSNLLFDSEIVEDFHYQNQGDKPKNIPDDEWINRKEIWDELLPGAGKLDDNGLLFKIVNEYDIDMLNLMKHIEEMVKKYGYMDTKE